MNRKQQQSFLYIQIKLRVKRREDPKKEKGCNNFGDFH